MWDSMEIAGAALRRAELIGARRKRRRENLKTGVLVITCVALVVCLVILPDLTSDPMPNMTSGAGPPLPAQGSVMTLSGAVIGGYVLIGVLTFSLGAVVTLLWRRRDITRQNNQEIEEGILRQVEAPSEKNKQKRARLKSAALWVVCVVLSICLIALPVIFDPKSSAGSGIIVSSHVLMGILAFALGATVTLLCLRLKDKNGGMRNET